METVNIGVVMHGVTGRMGTNQHLVRSILAINAQGGVALDDGRRVTLDPILVGRDSAKLERLAKAHEIARWTTDFDQALSDSAAPIFFDAASTIHRANVIGKAIAAGKHIYCEKPSAATLADAVDIWRKAESAGIKHGVVQDKLWLPGLRRLQYLRDSGFFGRLLSVRGEFGYWVFEGDLQPAQRPSWNYRVKDGGGIILDMMPHWRYVLDNIFGPVEAVSCLGAVHVPERWDERGEHYDADAEDAAYATFRLAGGVIAHFNSAWTVRVRRDDLLTLQVDGTGGSAVAGLRECWTQAAVNTPSPVWNPDEPAAMNYMRGWQKMPTNLDYANAFKVQWEAFIRHVYADAPFKWTLLEGAKGVQLAELAAQSWAERRWIDVPDLET